MYANYLIDVGKLVFIVGDTESTTQFRNLFQSAGNPKYLRSNSGKRFSTSVFRSCLQTRSGRKNTQKQLKALSARTGLPKSSTRYTPHITQNP
jgi:hypothetical protein